MFKRTSQFTDDEIISAIRKGGVERERMAAYLNKTFAGFISKVANRYHVSWEDAKDLYVDALITLLNKIRGDEYQGTGKLSTYFFGIFSHKCIDRVRQISTYKYNQQNNWTFEIPEIPDESRDFLKTFIANEQMEQIKEFLHRLGEKCKQLILDLDYWGYSPEEVMDRMGFTSTASIKTQKYKCKEKLKALLSSANINSQTD